MQYHFLLYIIFQIMPMSRSGIDFCITLQNTNQLNSMTLIIARQPKSSWKQWHRISYPELWMSNGGSATVLPSLPEKMRLSVIASVLSKTYGADVVVFDNQLWVAISRANDFVFDVIERERVDRYSDVVISRKNNKCYLSFYADSPNAVCDAFAKFSHKFSSEIAFVFIDSTLVGISRLPEAEGLFRAELFINMECINLLHRIMRHIPLNVQRVEAP